MLSSLTAVRDGLPLATGAAASTPMAWPSSSGRWHGQMLQVSRPFAGVCGVAEQQIGDDLKNGEGVWRFRKLGTKL